MYLCDDGNDPMKRDFCKRVSDVVYITGRYREKGAHACIHGRLAGQPACMHTRCCLLGPRRLLAPVLPAHLRPSALFSPPTGEINGKSSNLNNCLQHLYPRGQTIPNSEILIVFDADMVPTQNFFTKVLEVMQVGGPGVGRLAAAGQPPGCLQAASF